MLAVVPAVCLPSVRRQPFQSAGDTDEGWAAPSSCHGKQLRQSTLPSRADGTCAPDRKAASSSIAIMLSAPLCRQP